MASYLRPRRGKEATAKSQNIVLKRGEIFFETPAGGVGTGIGRLKMGDGSTSYASLPYFLRQLDLSDNNTKCAFTNVTAATSSQNNATYLNNIAPTNSLKTLFQNIKQLLLNYNSQLTSRNNDLLPQTISGKVEYILCSRQNDIVQFTILPFLRPDLYNIEFISQTKLGYSGDQYIAIFKAKRFKFDLSPYGINIYSTDADVLS